MIQRNDPQHFEKILEIRGHGRLWFSRDPSKLRESAQIGRTDIYAEVNLNADSIIRHSQAVLAGFGMKPKVEVATK